MVIWGWRSWKKVMAEGWYRKGDRSLGLGRAANGVAVGERLLTGVEMHQRTENALWWLVLSDRLRAGN